MMFQTIILRFTGRIYRFEQYHQYVQNLQSNTDVQSNELIPLCNQSQQFLDYIELSLQSTKKLSMMSWVSRQHDGAIAPHLIKNFANFRVFVETLAERMKDVIEKILLEKHTHTDNQRDWCINQIRQLLELAMECRRAHNSYGHVLWMAYLSICDIEEFVINPFGDIDNTSVVLGSYSSLGIDMLNGGKSQSNKFHRDYLQDIVSCINDEIPEGHLEVLGYQKIDDRTGVVNIVNGRPFCAVDAEHFLCKAWLIAKSTFANSLVSNHRKFCNAHTHPSTVLHQRKDSQIETIMDRIEQSFKRCIAEDQARMVPPELCRMKGEDVSFFNK
jgi:hypothetical protein